MPLSAPALASAPEAHLAGGGLGSDPPDGARGRLQQQTLEIDEAAADLLLT